jgi:hypothetical protein
MTGAGMQTLPDLTVTGVQVADDIRRRMEAEPGVWESFQSFPPLYQRVRLGYIEEVRKRNPNEWEKRLNSFIQRTAKGGMFGNWDDSGLPRTDPG